MSYDTRGLSRQPGTQEGARRVRLTPDELEVLGLQFQPGVNCPSCGNPIGEHADPDCLTVLVNALKRAAKVMVLAQEEAWSLGEENESLKEMADLIALWMGATQPDRGEHYMQLVALVRQYETGG